MFVLQAVILDDCSNLLIVEDMRVDFFFGHIFFRCKYINVVISNVKSRHLSIRKQFRHLLKHGVKPFFFNILFDYSLVLMSMNAPVFPFLTQGSLFFNTFNTHV